MVLVNGSGEDQEWENGGKREPETGGIQKLRTGHSTGGEEIWFRAEASETWL